MSVSLALDTSVAIPLLVNTHAAHEAVVRWWDGREVALSGHAVAETYSVLTRLPSDALARETYETVGVGVVIAG